MIPTSTTHAISRYLSLALIGLAILSSYVATFVSTWAIDWSIEYWGWFVGWMIPLPILMVLAWQRSARLKAAAVACLLAGSIGMALVLAFPHTDAARSTGVFPLQLAVCAGLALLAGRRSQPALHA